MGKEHPKDMKEKTYVEDIDRNIYDFKDEEKDAYKLKAGLTPEIVEPFLKSMEPRNIFCAESFKVPSTWIRLLVFFPK